MYTLYGLILIYREDFRPRTLRPWSSIRTGKEGTFDDRVTSREQYTYRQYIPPIAPNVRRETLKTADSEERSNSMTTYRRYLDFLNSLTSKKSQSIHLFFDKNEMSKIMIF